MNLDELDPRICGELKKHVDLLQAASDWMEHPDQKLLPKLEKLSKIVKGLYKHTSIWKLYRGLSLPSAHVFGQNLLGHSVDEFIAKDYKVGDEFTYNNDQFATAFSTSKTVARLYGEIIVELDIHPDSEHCLVFTDEIVYLIKELGIYTNGSNYEIPFINYRYTFSSKEVVLLPPFKKTVKIIEI